LKLAENAPKQDVFLRQATGLVKAWSARDAFYYVILQLSVGLWINLTISTNAYAWPGGASWLGGLFATALFCFPSAVYAMLIVVMPRSGGDYVFQTRILGVPLLSYIAMGLWLIGNAWFLPYVWITVGGTSWAPFLGMLGVRTGSQFLINAAAWITTPEAVFAFGFFVVFWMWLVNAFGLRTYGRIQFYFFWAAIISSVVFYAWIFLTPTSTFIAQFNAVAPKFGGTATNAYQNIMSLAQTSGFNPNFHFSVYQSLAQVGAWSAIFVVGYYTALGGEIRRAGTLKSQMWISVGGCIFVGLMNTLLAFGVENMVGHQFNADAGWLLFNGKWPLTIPPYSGLFTMALGGAVLPIVALIYFNSWTWMNYPNIIPYNTRVSMAMAFDRMLPSKMADVNEKYHIPLFNINIWTLACLGLIFLAFALSSIFGELFLLSSFTLSSVLILSCLAGAVLPFVKSQRAAYEASSVSKLKIGRLPLITLLGVIAICVEIFVDYLLLTNPYLGVSGGNIAFSLEFVIALAVFFGCLYYYFKLKNKRHGIDVTMAFNQIPPE
jgi:basic amino acid/polyamine antiporter, APA family